MPYNLIIKRGKQNKMFDWFILEFVFYWSKYEIHDKDFALESFILSCIIWTKEIGKKIPSNLTSMEKDTRQDFYKKIHF